MVVLLNRSLCSKIRNGDMVPSLLKGHFENRIFEKIRLPGKGAKIHCRCCGTTMDYGTKVWVGYPEQLQPPASVWRNSRSKNISSPRSYIHESDCEIEGFIQCFDFYTDYENGWRKSVVAGPLGKRFIVLSSLDGITLQSNNSIRLQIMGQPRLYQEDVAAEPHIA